MQSFKALIALALGAVALAQAPKGQAAPAGGADEAPCPPQFQLQCCQHVISAPDAALFKITVDAKANPGLAGTQCAALAPTGQCQAYPVCCKNVQSSFSAACIPA